MSECNLQTKYAFTRYEKPSKWYHKWVHIQYPCGTRYFTIGGNSVEEIRIKKDGIKNQLQKEWGDKYEIRVTNYD